MSSGRPSYSYLFSITIQPDKCLGNEDGILFKQTNQLIGIQKKKKTHITCIIAFQNSGICDKLNKSSSWTSRLILCWKWLF